MTRNRSYLLTGCASAALLAAPALATSHSVSAVPRCDLAPDGPHLVVVLGTAYWPAGSTIDDNITANGAAVHSATATMPGPGGLDADPTSPTYGLSLPDTTTVSSALPAGTSTVTAQGSIEGRAPGEPEVWVDPVTGLPAQVRFSDVLTCQLPPEQGGEALRTPPAPAPAELRPREHHHRRTHRPRSCAWLVHHHAGIGRFTSHHPRCAIPPRLRHHSPPLVTGSLEPTSATVSQGGYTYSAFKPTRGMGVSGRATVAHSRTAARGGRLQVQLVAFGTVRVGQEFFVPKPDVTYTATVSTGSCSPGSATYVTRARIRFPSTGVVTPWARSAGRSLGCA